MALARLAAQAGDLPPAEGAVQPVFPSRALQVLLPHRAEPELSKIDALGRRLTGWTGRLSNPQKRLRRMAKRVDQQRAHHAGLDDTGFADAVDTLAARAKFEHSGAATRLGQVELDALALVAEGVKRTHGFYPFIEQFMGAIALLEGQVAEMATGEGKTITATMAAIVAAWRGLPCHVITSNDYLSARDCELGQPLFALCKVSAASVTGDTPPDQRRAGHAHDIVYTTAKDMLADHLRDDIAMGARADRTQFVLNAMNGGAKAGVTMRGVFQVVVDEADSVLIDDAVTPLIISEPTPDSLLNEAAVEAVTLARALTEGEDFTVTAELKQVRLTRAGRRRLAALSMNAGPFWQSTSRTEEFVTLALQAMHAMQRDRHYVVEDGKVVLIDELTGRLARQRTLSLGLHQVLEASLGLELSDPSEVRARLSFQRFFRRLPKLGGMTGTAREAQVELQSVYGLSVVEIPTHRKSRRKWRRHRVFKTETAKFRAIVQQAETLAAKGCAVLIGVRSVQASEVLARAFAEHAPSLHPAVLNATNDKEEAALVEVAGLPGAVTVATNMAGRGTDIKIDPQVEKLGGLHVIIGESNDFSRIDRQLEGRCARQGDPGVVQRFISMDEELFRRFLPTWRRRLWQMTFATGINRQHMAARMLTVAQSRAEKLARGQRGASLMAEIETEKKMF